MTAKRELALIELEAHARRRLERESQALFNRSDVERWQVVPGFQGPETVVTTAICGGILGLLPVRDNPMKCLGAGERQLNFFKRPEKGRGPLGVSCEDVCKVACWVLPVTIAKNPEHALDFHQREPAIAHVCSFNPRRVRARNPGRTDVVPSSLAPSHQLVGEHQTIKVVYEDVLVRLERAIKSR